MKKKSNILIFRRIFGAQRLGGEFGYRTLRLGALEEND